MGSPVTSPKQEFRKSRIHATVEDDPEEYIPHPRSLPTIPRPASVAASSAPSTVGHGNALSQLQPSQVRTMREAFQILDRDSDGSVNREDVVDMLNQLGRADRILLCCYHRKLGQLTSRVRSPIKSGRRVPLLPSVSAPDHVNGAVSQLDSNLVNHSIAGPRIVIRILSIRRRRQRPDRRCRA